MSICAGQNAPPERAKIAVQCVDSLTSTAEGAEKLSIFAGEQLDSVVNGVPLVDAIGCGTPKEEETWPPLFSAIRTLTTRIDRALARIDSTLRSVEL